MTKIKQYRIIQTYLVDIEEGQDINEVWMNITNREDYEEDEIIELIAEV